MIGADGGDRRAAGRAGRRSCTRLPQTLINVPVADKARGRGRAGGASPRSRPRRPSSATTAGCCCGRPAPSRSSGSWSRRRPRSQPTCSPTASPRPSPPPDPPATGTNDPPLADVRARLGCGPMCGIVGYVGSQQALAVVLEGLRRLEYRGYDSAGSPCSTAGWSSRSVPAASRTWTRPSPPSTRGIVGTTGHRAHPLGHPRRADRPQRPPAPGHGQRGRRHPQRDHRELRAAAGRAGGGRGRAAQRDRHRGRRPPRRRSTR